MSSKEQYRLLCLSESSIPIYSRDWWLDIVCGEKHWDVLLATQKEAIVAALPIYTPCPGIISMPFFTQTMGPWFAPDADTLSYRRQLTKRQEILKTFIEELKHIPTFLQNFHPDITDWLPFYWAGYEQTTRYTYILDDISDSTHLWQQMSANIRRNITRAEQRYRIVVRRNVPVEDFLRIQGLSFRRQDLDGPKGIPVLRELILRSRERGQGDIWGGYDAEGNLHAAAFIVWQKSSAYYLAGGGNPELRDSGAHSLVLWTAIRELAAHTRQFDFEGSMLPGVERFFREFGAKQYPFFTITKGNLSLWHRMRIKLNSLNQKK